MLENLRFLAGFIHPSLVWSPRKEDLGYGSWYQRNRVPRLACSENCVNLTVNVIILLLIKRFIITIQEWKQLYICINQVPRHVLDQWKMQLLCELPLTLKHIGSLFTFKRNIRIYFLSSYWKMHLVYIYVRCKWSIVITLIALWCCYV